MNRSIINEKDISSTVRDFETLCSYILENRLTLTPGGALGKKACFDLNSSMEYPVLDAKVAYQMFKYPSISMYLAIALGTRLLEPGADAGQKAAITATEAYEEYQQMDKYSKYLFIFLAWMRYIDTDAQYGNAMNIGWFDITFIESAMDQAGKTRTPGAVFQREERYNYFSSEPIQRLMFECVPLMRHLRDLGLIGYNDEDTEKLSAYTTVVNKAWFTRLGVIISAACSTRRFSWVNALEVDCVINSEHEIEVYENDFDQNPPGSAGFLKPFLACFPENGIDADAVNKLLFPQPETEPDDLVYEFRVSLGRDCYREILCWGYNDFESLHLAIQRAFDFDNDHLYAFYLDGKKGSRRSINAPYTNEPPLADDVYLCEAGLRVKQKILYLFDFGDQWMFDVTVLSITNSDDVPESPIVTKSVGEAPDQYPNYDEDWDEELDEELDEGEAGDDP